MADKENLHIQPHRLACTLSTPTKSAQQYDSTVLGNTICLNSHVQSGKSIKSSGQAPGKCSPLSEGNQYSSVPRHHATPILLTRQVASGKVSKSAFRKLKHSKLDLERQLAARKEKESLMELKLQHLTDVCVVRAKDRNLRKSIHSVSSAVFLVIFGFLLYCNYVMFSPHLNAIVMAILLSSVLNNLHETVANRIAVLQRQIDTTIESYILSMSSIVGNIITIHTSPDCGRNQRARNLLATLLVAVVAAPMPDMVAMYVIAMFGKFVMVTVLATVVLCSSINNRRLAAGILTVLVVTVIGVPSVYIVRGCLMEAEMLARFLVQLPDKDLDVVIAKATNHPWLMDLKTYAAEFGIEMPLGLETIENGTKKTEWIKDNLVAVAGNYVDVFSSSLLSVFTNASNMLWAFTTFASTLIYLMQAESPWESLAHVSPLSPEDNEQIRISLTHSTTRIFLCSACVGCCHAIAAYSVLCMSTFPLPTIVALASGVMAVMPLVGTYIVSFPIALYLWMVDETMQAVAYIGMELAMLLWLDSWIYSKIPGHSYYVGLSVVFGMYQFGWFGFVLGPLIIGLTMTAMSIYTKYLRKPLLQDILTSSPMSFTNENDMHPDVESILGAGTEREPDSGYSTRYTLRESPFQSVRQTALSKGMRSGSGSGLRQSVLMRGSASRKRVPVRSIQFSPSATPC